MLGNSEITGLNPVEFFWFHLLKASLIEKVDGINAERVAYRCRIFASHGEAQVVQCYSYNS